MIPVRISLAAVLLLSATTLNGQIGLGGSSNARRLNGIGVSSTSPTSGQALVYNSTSKQWEPAIAGGAPGPTGATGLDAGSCIITMSGVQAVVTQGSSCTSSTHNLTAVAGVSCVDGTGAGVDVPYSLSGLTVTIAAFSGTCTVIGSSLGSYRTAANSIVLLGDSITAFNSSTPSSFNLGGPLDTGYFTWTNALLGQRFTILNNAGVPGETTSQILARVQTGVVAYHPTYCLVMAGINDVTASIPAATAWTNLKAIYTALGAAGIRVIATTVTPSSTFDSAKAAIWADLNRRIKEYGKVTANMIVVDAARAYIDYSSATAASLSGYTSDGVHPTAKGAYAIGLLLYNALNPLIPAMDTLQVHEADPGNLLSNSMMSGTGGNLNSVATGSIATSWIADKQGSPTCVLSKGTRSDLLGVTQIITLSSGAGYASTCAIKQEASAAGYAIGDNVFVQAEVLAATTTVEADIEFWDSSFSFLKAAQAVVSLTGGTPITSLGSTAIFRSPSVVVPATTAHIYIYVTVRGTSGAATIGRVEARKASSL